MNIKGPDSTSKISSLITDEEKKFIINDRFKILKKVGIGGMGEIFLAEDLKLRRQVAIKSIKKGSDSDSESKMRFLREAQTASQLEHTNICPIYEIYEEENNHYIVMQYIDGVTLDAIVRYKELKIQKILDIGLQICEGMNEAHEKGIIHRDLKPGNIIINKKGIVKILDFGLAKFRDGSDSMKTGIVNSNLTEKGIVMGTVAYMSPEQARGEDLDNRSDIFSFGILLYELIEGKNPFYDKEQINTLYNVINKDIEYSNKFSPPLVKLLTALLKKKKAERLSEFSEIKSILLEIQDELDLRRKEKIEIGATEIIDIGEKREMLDEIRRTSDIEDLGELVYKIKKIKAKTIPLISTKTNLFKRISIVFTLILMMFSAFLFFKSKTNLSFSGGSDIFFINVNDLDGDAPDIVKKGVKFLTRESLDQFDEFDTVTPETINSISRSDEDNSDSKTIKNKYRIFYDLRGSISKIDSIYNFDIVISSNNGSKKYSMTIPGLENKDSILKHQIDMLSEKIYKKIFPLKKGNLEIKAISSTYGKKWDKFESFFTGLGDFYKYEYMDAEKSFAGTDETPADKYYLANIYYFRGSRTLAKKKIEEIIPLLDHIIEPVKLKVLALNARLEFNFNDEIEYLNKLMERNILSKKTLFELGEAFFHHGNAEKAASFYSDALNLDSEFSSAINHLGYCNSYMGDHTRAIELFEEYRNLDNSANSFDSLGDGYFFSGELISSEASKKAAIRKDSKGVYWAYLTLSDIAILKARFNDARDAVRDYLKVTDSIKDIGNAYSKLAYIEYLQGEHKQALSTIERSLKVFDSDNINSNSSEQRWIRALINLKMGRNKAFLDDLEWLNKIVNRFNLNAENFASPYKFYLHLNSIRLENEGKINEADSSFRELLDMNTQLNYWITIFNYQFFKTEYSVFLQRNGNLKESETEINKCLEYSADFIPALWQKANLMESSDIKEAGKYYRKLKKLYGDEVEINVITDKLRKKLKITKDSFSEHQQ